MDNVGVKRVALNKMTTGVSRVIGRAHVGESNTPETFYARFF